MRYKLRDDNINFMFTEGHNIPLSSRGKIVRKMSFAFRWKSCGSESLGMKQRWKNEISFYIGWLPCLDFRINDFFP